MWIPESEQEILAAIRYILRTSPVGCSQKLAPDTGQWHHAPLSLKDLTLRASVLRKEASNHAHRHWPLNSRCSDGSCSRGTTVGPAPILHRAAQASKRR